jgi:hypothetical protein
MGSVLRITLAGQEGETVVRGRNARILLASAADHLIAPRFAALSARDRPARQAALFRCPAHLQKDFAMKDVFFFDSMLTPKIIIFIYWLGLISVVIGAIGTMFSEYGGGFWAGLGILLFGLIGTRVWCELLIVLFKINENLQKIANRQ